MPKTLRSHKKPPTPNTLGIYGRHLSTQDTRTAISECYKVEPEGPFVFLDASRGVDLSAVPKQVVFSTSDVLAESGYYTWILVKRGHGFEIVGSKALTQFEIGSKHRDLYFDAGRPRVYAAGECRVQRRAGEVSIEFNLESGTFMKEIMEALEYEEDVEGSPTDYYADFITSLWAQAGATIVRYVRHSLLADLPKTLLRSTVEAYRRAGYVPYMFENSVYCDLYKAWTIHKRFMGETRDYPSWVAATISDAPTAITKEPAVFRGGRRMTRRRRKSKRGSRRHL